MVCSAGPTPLATQESSMTPDLRIRMEHAKEPLERLVCNSHVQREENANWGMSFGVDPVRQLKLLGRQ